MKSLSSFTNTYNDLILLSIIAPLVIIYSFFSISRKASHNNKKRLPPEVPGRWPIVGHLPLLASLKIPYIAMGEIADKIGPIFTVKLGVHRVLIVNSWEMAKECLTTNDEAFASRPKSLVFEVMGYNYAMFGASPHGDYWRQMRKISTLELLSNHRLDQLRHMRETEVKEAVQGLYKKWVHNKNNFGKIEVEMKQWFWDINLNYILKVVVGKRYVDYNSAEGSDEQDTWQNCVREFFEMTGKFAVSDALPFLRWLDLGGVEGAMKKAFKELDKIMDQWLQEHKQKKAKPEGEDFMDVLLSSLDNAKMNFSEDPDTINKATCLALILAASDITRAMLTWTLSLLLNHPNILKKAQQELQKNVSQERQVEESDTKNLEYIQAIIKESFRLYPPGPLSVPRESIKDCTVGGYHIPAGTRLHFNLSKIHRDPRVWENPLEFQPERFLTTHKNFDIRGKNYELMPFGTGRRMCPGASFSVQILNLILASLLHAFEIETVSGEIVDMTEGAGIVNLKATPLQVLLNPRLPAHLY